MEVSYHNLFVFYFFLFYFSSFILVPPQGVLSGGFLPQFVCFFLSFSFISLRLYLFTCATTRCAKWRFLATSWLAIRSTFSLCFLFWPRQHYHGHHHQNYHFHIFIIIIITFLVNIAIIIVIVNISTMGLINPVKTIDSWILSISSQCN